MKKICLLILALVLCLALAACHGNADATEPTATFPTVSEELAHKDVAFTCYNYDFDVYTYFSWQPGPVFYILTKEHVATGQISVKAPVGWSYNAYIYELTNELSYYELDDCSQDSNGYYYAFGGNLTYHAYLYQTSRGIDWETVGALKATYSALCDQLYALDEGETEQYQAIASELSKAKAAYYEAENAFLDEYSLLESGDLPTFYLYKVELFFSSSNGIGNQSFNQLEVTVGGETYTLDIGEIRLHEEQEGSTYAKDPDRAVDLYSSGGMQMSNFYPYGTGVEEREGFILRTNKDITLMSCNPLAGSTTTAEVLEIRLVISDDSNCNYGIEMVWDGKSEIQVAKGKYVKFSFVVKDERMKEVFYGNQIYMTVTYKHDIKPYTITCGLSMYRDIYNPWFWYAVCFQELDLESYFNNCFYTLDYQLWKKDYA